MGVTGVTVPVAVASSPPRLAVIVPSGVTLPVAAATTEPRFPTAVATTLIAPVALETIPPTDADADGAGGAAGQPAVPPDGDTQ